MGDNEHSPTSRAQATIAASAQSSDSKGAFARATTPLATYGASALPPHLRKWVATCLLDGYSAARIAPKLAEYLPDPEGALHEVQEIERDPVFAAATAVHQRRNKLASLLDALARQLRLSRVAEGVPVEVGISPERFYADYYFANRPVVVRGLMDRWPALRSWTPELFAQRFPDNIVEVSDDRESDPRYEDRFTQHRREMTMTELVRRIRSNAGNNLYLVAKNRLLDRPEFAELRGDFAYPEGFLDPALITRQPSLWLGGQGTMTPLHHDASNIFFGQVYGRKRVWLIPPYEIEHIYNDRTCFSAIDIEAPDFAAFPLLHKVLILEVVVEPGDFLLFPLGWWHAVRSLDVSISLSFQNFATPGGPVVWRS